MKLIFQPDTFGNDGSAAVAAAAAIDAPVAAEELREFWVMAMWAVGSRRRMMTVHLDKECAGRPIARVHCSLLQLSYRAVTTGACPLPFVDELTRPVGRDSPSAMERALTLPLPGCAARTPSSGDAAMLTSQCDMCTRY